MTGSRYIPAAARSGVTMSATKMLGRCMDTNKKSNGDEGKGGDDDDEKEDERKGGVLLLIAAHWSA